jgi:hypothetical protein
VRKSELQAHTACPSETVNCPNPCILLHTSFQLPPSKLHLDTLEPRQVTQPQIVLAFESTRVTALQAFQHCCPPHTRTFKKKEADGPNDQLALMCMHYGRSFEKNNPRPWYHLDLIKPRFTSLHACLLVDDNPRSQFLNKKVIYKPCQRAKANKPLNTLTNCRASRHGLNCQGLQGPFKLPRS